MTNAEIANLLRTAMLPYLSAFLDAPAALAVDVTNQAADAVVTMSAGDFAGHTIARQSGWEAAFALLCDECAPGRAPTLQPVVGVVQPPMLLRRAPKPAAAARRRATPKKKATKQRKKPR